MKKAVKFAISLATIFVLGILTLPMNQAEAAWSGWQDVPEAGSSCQVNVYTDATNYYRGAGTIGAKAEQRGNCGQLNYMVTVQDQNWYNIGSSQSGYFNYSTPMKYFNISSLHDNGGDGVEYNARVVFSFDYRSSGWYDAVASAPINIHSFN
jgi:hypothetical protein